MALISDYICVDLLAIVITIAVGIVTFFKWTYKYWERKGVPSMPQSIPFGSMPNPLGSEEISFSKRLQQIHLECKRKGYKHVGVHVFANPIYLPVDTEHIKNMMTRDFHHFSDRDIYHNEKDDPLSAHLFALKGLKWRNLRAKMTPTFTSGKMKMMFHTLVECGDQMKEAIDGICEKGEPIDAKDVLARFTIDIIGSCAFGLTCNSFKQPQSDFRTYGSKLFRISASATLKNIFSFTFPNLSRKLGVMFTPKDVSEFFLNVIRDTVEYREKNNVTRNDFLQMMIALKNNVKIGDEEPETLKHDGKTLTFEELAAQAFVFFIAGFDTSSMAMTYCLFELSQNQDMQDRVRNEVRSNLAKHDGKLTYESLSEMKYLTQVVEETLRMYPPIMLLFRQCTKDYPVPDTNVVIEQGTGVMISTYGLHYDPENFPNPDKFDPERFSPENKSKMDPFNYLPFGEGPRNCIGLRFGLMQIKVGMAVLLKDYRFRLNPGTKLPLEFEKFSFVMATVHDILLDVEKVRE